MAELAHYVCEVELVRDPGLGGLGGGAARGPNGHVLVPSSQLVPGDVVVVTAGKVPYDGVLIEGECVMDETVLTGESETHGMACRLGSSWGQGQAAGVVAAREMRVAQKVVRVPQPACPHPSCPAS